MGNNELQAEILRLEQENKELKKENERLKTLYRNEGITDICESCSIASAMEAYDYHSALEEIREIADKCKECLNEDDDCGCDYLRIKRRIDEVLGNECN